MNVKLVFLVLVFFIGSCQEKRKSEQGGHHGWKSPGYGTASSSPRTFAPDSKDTIYTLMMKKEKEMKAEDSLERASRVQDSLRNLKK